MCIAVAENLSFTRSSFQGNLANNSQKSRVFRTGVSPRVENRFLSLCSFQGTEFEKAKPHQISLVYLWKVKNYGKYVFWLGADPRDHPAPQSLPGKEKRWCVEKSSFWPVHTFAT
jgi:hypothetical protein